jgi:hypothetical protein
MTYVVVDEWKLVSATRTVAITVKRAPGQSGGGADKTAPTLKLHARSPLRLRTALRRGIRLTARASERGQIVIEALAGANARRLGIDARVGSLARDLAPGRTRLKLRLYRDVRGQLATLHRVRLRLVARMADAAGNVRTKRLRITLVK